MNDVIYYCKSCLSGYEDGHCVNCGQPQGRILTHEELMYQRAAMRVLRNHRAEFFNAVEVEKQNDY